MIVIIGTSCIVYLIIIDKLFLLKDNFSEIIIPLTVHKEILRLSISTDFRRTNNEHHFHNNQTLYTNILHEANEL
jgi:hypothetical protein